MNTRRILDFSREIERALDSSLSSLSFWSYLKKIRSKLPGTLGDGLDFVKRKAFISELTRIKDSLHSLRRNLIVSSRYSDKDIMEYTDKWTALLRIIDNEINDMVNILVNKRT